MKTSSLLVLAALTLAGAASAVSVTRQNIVIAGSVDDDESGHAGPDSARVVAYFNALGSADPMLCAMVTDQLGNFWSSEGDDGIGSLADASRRWEPARDSLASRITDPAAKRVAFRALAVDDACVRRSAAKMLGRSGSHAAAEIRQGLRAANPRVREATLLALGESELPEFLTDAEQATRDDNPAVVAMATWALGEYKQPSSFGRLEQLVGSRELRVRRAAAWALGELDDPRAAPLLTPLLRDPDILTRIVATEALAEIADATTVEALGAVLGDPNLRLRRAVVRALAEIEDLATVPYLLKAIKDSDPEIRRIAAEALGDRKDN